MRKTNKNNLPKKDAKTKQGFYSCINPEKYIGDKNKIIYRSSWEYMFMAYCDQHPKIISWTSEPEGGIPYFNPIKKIYSTYFPDFLMRVALSENSFLDYLVEIKPKKEYLKKPTISLNPTLAQRKAYNYLLETYIINCAKFEAATNYCKERGKEFIVIDDEWINKKSKM